MTTEAHDRRNAVGSLPGKIIEWNLLLVINNSADVWLNADKMKSENRADGIQDKLILEAE
jgi:hypothetical protein